MEKVDDHLRGKATTQKVLQKHHVAHHTNYVAYLYLALIFKDLQSGHLLVNKNILYTNVTLLLCTNFQDEIKDSEMFLYLKH